MLVFLNIESAVIVPAKSDSIFESLETVQVRAAVRTVTHGRITVGNKLVVVGAESLPCLICRLLEYNNHEGTHQESCVALLSVVKRCVMVDLIVLILRVIHELFKFLAKEMNLAQIKGSEVGKKWFIHQIVINAEIEGMLA